MIKVGQSTMANAVSVEGKRRMPPFHPELALNLPPCRSVVMHSTRLSIRVRRRCSIESVGPRGEIGASKGFDRKSADRGDKAQIRWESDRWSVWLEAANRQYQQRRSRWRESAVACTRATNLGDKVFDLLLDLLSLGGHVD
jgi:hypothetical protein